MFSIHKGNKKGRKKSRKGEKNIKICTVKKCLASTVQEKESFEKDRKREGRKKGNYSRYTLAD